MRLMPALLMARGVLKVSFCFFFFYFPLPFFSSQSCSHNRDYRKRLFSGRRRLVVLVVTHAAPSLLPLLLFLLPGSGVVKNLSSLMSFPFFSRCRKARDIPEGSTPSLPPYPSFFFPHVPRRQRNMNGVSLFPCWRGEDATTRGTFLSSNFRAEKTCTIAVGEVGAL